MTILPLAFHRLIEWPHLHRDHFGKSGLSIEK
jgi:hypothetical protein